jgi:hypothetical protein
VWVYGVYAVLGGVLHGVYGWYVGQMVSNLAHSFSYIHHLVCTCHPCHYSMCLGLGRCSQVLSFFGQVGGTWCSGSGGGGWGTQYASNTMWFMFPYHGMSIWMVCVKFGTIWLSLLKFRHKFTGFVLVWVRLLFYMDIKASIRFEFWPNEVGLVLEGV